MDVGLKREQVPKVVYAIRCHVLCDKLRESEVTKDRHSIVRVTRLEDEGGRWDERGPET